MGSAITKSHKPKRGSTPNIVKPAEENIKNHAEVSHESNEIAAQKNAEIAKKIEMSKSGEMVSGISSIDPEKRISQELNGIDWNIEISKRRKNLVAGSMPNIRPDAQSTSSAPFNPFARLASSAEDESVGAIRTRIMNASFGRRNSNDSGVNRPKTTERRKSMPALSMTMPARAMKQVFSN